jgi:hypothetical protein
VCVCLFLSRPHSLFTLADATAHIRLLPCAHSLGHASVTSQYCLLYEMNLHCVLHGSAVTTVWLAIHARAVAVAVFAGYDRTRCLQRSRNAVNSAIRVSLHASGIQPCRERGSEGLRALLYFLPHHIPSTCCVTLSYVQVDYADLCVRLQSRLAGLETECVCWRA